MSQLKESKIIVIGIPLDSNSSYLAGASLAPGKIKESLYSSSSNMWTEDLLDLEVSTRWQIEPDVDVSHDQTAFQKIEKEVDTLLNDGSQVISLGGDHSITFPIVKAFAKHYENLNILHLDAHPDLYDELDGNRYSHASPFARIMENRLAARLVQVGIRTMTGHQKEQVERFPVEVLDMRKRAAAKDLIFDGPVYLSIDIDCLDPAFAPGVSHYEPGGMSTREVLEIIQSFKGNVIGADIVEYNPDRDINGMTGMVAAKLLKEILGRMLR